MARQRFIEISKSFFVDADFEQRFKQLGLISVEAIFSFTATKNLTKKNLARFRSRLQFETNSPPATLFLKRYDRPPALVQLRNWLAHRRRRSCGFAESVSAEELAAAGLNTPKTVSYGEQWGLLFEKRSFVVAEKIPDAEALERRLPDCFDVPAAAENLRLRRDFIARLAGFVKSFHETNYRHRDLYLSHIFYGENGQFHLIDLARAFRPLVLRRRFQIKDIAELYYSAPARNFSKTDRLRFYFGYTGRRQLTAGDKTFIRKVMNKAKRMARREMKHGRRVPFAE